MTNETIIVSNQVRCTVCGDTPYSAHRHDYKSCKCEAIAVDGGMDYLKRTGDSYEELSIVLKSDTINQCLEAMKWADETNRNERGKLYAILRVLRDTGAVNYADV